MSQSFNDNANRTWVVDVDLLAISRVREKCGVLLTDLADGQLVVRLFGDLIFAVDVAAAILEPRMSELGISADQFRSAMAGDSIEAAASAILEGIASFLPKARGAALRSALSAMRRAEALVMDAAEKHLDGILDNMELEISKMFPAVQPAA